MVAAVQLDQGPMNTRQLRMQVIGSVVLGQDGVNGFGRVGIQGLPWISEDRRWGGGVREREAWAGFIGALDR